MQKVRFGIVGLRRGKSFVRVCAAVRGAEVTALHDIDVDRLDGAASELNVRAFESLEDMLASDEVDCVVIASPLPVHAEQAALALEAGKHVLSEVTACSTLEQARALVAAAEGSSAVYMMAENYRYLDELELVRRLEVPTHESGLARSDPARFRREGSGPGPRRLMARPPPPRGCADCAAPVEKH